MIMWAQCCLTVLPCSCASRSTTGAQTTISPSSGVSTPAGSAGSKLSTLVGPSPSRQCRLNCCPSSASTILIVSSGASSPASAAAAKRRSSSSSTGSFTPWAYSMTRPAVRGSGRLVFVGFGIGFDNASDDGMANHIACVKESCADPLNGLEQRNGLAQSALHVRRQVDLGQITGNHCPGAKTDAGQKHLHLFGGGVLGLIKNDKCVIERAPAHIGQRRHFNHIALGQPGRLVKAKHFIQRVVQRAQIRVHFLSQITRQKAQPFTSLNRRAHQHNTLHAIGFKDRKSTRLNSSHVAISYAVFCLKKKRNT